MTKEALTLALDKKADNARELGLDYEPENTLHWHALNYRTAPTQNAQAMFEALEKFVAQPEEEKLHPVHIGVDVTREGTAVTAFYRKPDAVMEMFYSQFHPLAQPEKTVCPFCSSEWVTAEQHDRKMDRMEQERCVGCEACIDAACGRDECPKGWPKAVQPEQEPDKYVMDIECTKCGAKQSGVLTVNTTPPQRKPLTDEEIGAILEGVNAYGTRLYTFARAIEAAHNIKE